jgi:transcriptional regulator with XRE-family HTH domain
VRRSHTQAEVAERMGTSQSTVARLMRIPAIVSTQIGPS